MNTIDLRPGTLLRAKFKTNPDDSLFKNVYIPLKVVAEYPEWFLCEVQPHRNPVNSWGISKPYPMTMSKFALRTGRIKIRPYGSGRPILVKKVNDVEEI